MRSITIHLLLHDDQFYNTARAAQRTGQQRLQNPHSVRLDHSFNSNILEKEDVNFEK
ncbi:MAG TPA: hypothetical protein VLC28_03740 [Flavitalea sp.]|nr:hypothetical protein [Flavitalea sp.]